MNYTSEVAPEEIALEKEKKSFFKKAKTEIKRIHQITLRKLNKCKQTGKCILVSSYALGEGTFRSFVEDIYKDDANEIVVLKWFDNNNLPSLTHVFIDEINSVNLVDRGMKNSYR